VRRSSTSAAVCSGLLHCSRITITSVTVIT
jgi:hypothetical protein